MNQAAKKTSITNKQPQKKERETLYRRDAAKQAILDAAEKLLSEHSPNEITVRQIARLAGVSHTLLHRYFGTKENVIMSVHERSAGKMANLLSDVESIDGNLGLFFRTTENNRSRRIILTRAMIDGVAVNLIQHHFPVMRKLLELLRKRKNEIENPSKYDAEILSAFFAATVMGFFLYEPFIMAATGLENRDRDEVHNQIIAMLEEMVDKFC